MCEEKLNQNGSKVAKQSTKVKKNFEYIFSELLDDENGLPLSQIDPRSTYEKLKNTF